jgi:hypothetical protein
MRAKAMQGGIGDELNTPSECICKLLGRGKLEQVGREGNSALQATWQVISGAAKLDFAMAELDSPLASRWVSGTLIQLFNLVITNTPSDADRASLVPSSSWMGTLQLRGIGCRQ